MKAHTSKPYLSLAQAVVRLAIEDGDWRFLCSDWGEELVDGSAVSLSSARDMLADDIARAMGDKGWLDDRTASAVVWRRLGKMPELLKHCVCLDGSPCGTEEE